MTPRFSVEVDPALDLVRIYLGGFFRPEDVPAFVARRDVAHRQLRSAPNEHVTLVDMREMAIQPQDVVAHFGAVLNNKAMESRRLAFVTAKSLARLQVQRAADKRNAAFFSDMNEAEAWLLEPRPVAA
jgi:hypothetical protein